MTGFLRSSKTSRLLPKFRQILTKFRDVTLIVRRRAAAVARASAGGRAAARAAVSAAASVREDLPREELQSYHVGNMFSSENQFDLVTSFALNLLNDNRILNIVPVLV